MGLLYHSTVHHQRKSGQELKYRRNLEAGADAEAVRGMLLLDPSWFCSACFLAEPRTTSLEMALPTMGWALPH